MIIKARDDIRPSIAKLVELLATKTLSKEQKESLEEELVRIRAGEQGEREAAYQIDFQLKESKNWAVIHDLRLEHNGRVAQIDHLVIGRYFDIFAIESKNFTTALRVDPNGEFQIRTRYGWKGISSPIEQNKKHIIVLNELINDQRLTPMRLGLPIKPAFRNWILEPPGCQVSHRHIDEAIILKMDMFDRRLREFMSSSSLAGDFLSLAKLCSSQGIIDFARKLVSFHRPASFDFAARFGISMDPVGAPAAAHELARITCDACTVPVEAKVAVYCRAREMQFAGRILCRSCQITHNEKAPAPPQPLPVAACVQCATPVDAKVVAFCRFNSRKFDKQVLCRTCQAMFPAAPRVSPSS